jgi:hypothetical protein
MLWGGDDERGTASYEGGTDKIGQLLNEGGVGFVKLNAMAAAYGPPVRFGCAAGSSSVHNAVTMIVVLDRPEGSAHSFMNVGKADTMKRERMS